MEPMRKVEVRLPAEYAGHLRFVKSHAADLPSLSATPRRQADVLRDIVRRGLLDAMREIRDVADGQPLTTEAMLEQTPASAG
ncbi:MAG: hypothetical protein MOGMAGMI_02444 [Candidatus Omnitrophica bacterium]|nr:hypothetical protein [Candidatus Omnitrophota bacterium]